MIQIKPLKIDWPVFLVLVCFQHVTERDNKTSDKLLASTSDKKNILSDIYGSQKKKGFIQFGLANAIDVSSSMLS